MARGDTSLLFCFAALPILFALAATPTARAGNATVSHAAARGTPPEVTAFLRRRAGCGRLSGDVGDDPERVADTVKSRFWMKCSTIDDDERRLRARYANSPDIIDALDQSGDADSSE